MADTSSHEVRRDPLPARRKRRINVDNALIPAIAALVGALIGAAVSIFITIYQIKANQAQTIYQIRAGQAQAANDFLRSQRQAAYSAFLNDANQLRYDWSLYYFNHATSLAGEINSLNSKLQSDYADLELVGPKEISREGQSALIEADIMTASVGLGLGHDSSIFKPSAKAAKSSFPHYESYIETLATDMSRVVNGN